MLNCKTVHARYTVDLAKNKENQAPIIPKSACEKRKLINVECCIKKTEEDVSKYFVDAEKYFNPELLKTGNKLSKTIKENSEKKKKLEHGIARLELDLKEIS